MKKQREKSQQTREEIKKAASSLFESKGYVSTSVNDICELSGYSVGAFYGHFTSKQELAEKIWVDIMVNTIVASVEKGSAIEDKDRFIEYIVEDSEKLSQNHLTYELKKFTTFSNEAFETVSSYAARYLCMLYNKIKQYNPEISEEMAWNNASAIHSLINANAQKTRDFSFTKLSPDGLKKVINYLLLMPAAE